MAISADTAWEVRGGVGSDTSGGGFVAGGSGTDWSQQTSPQYSVTDAITAGTTTITSASASFGTDVVGNILYISGGTGSITAARYQIVSRTNSTTIVVDRSTGLTTGTGATLKIGGALATVQAAHDSMTLGNKIFFKGSYTSTSSTVLSTAGGQGGATGNYNRLIGYSSTRTDAGKATITLSTNTGLTAIQIAAGGWVVENLTLDCASLGTSTGIKCTSGADWTVRNCLVKNFTSNGIRYAGGTGPLVVRGCEVTGGTSAGGDVAIQYADYVTGCNVHDNACPGIETFSAGVIAFNLITNNTGATSDGIVCDTGEAVTIINNTIYGSGRDALSNRNSSTIALICTVRNNIFAGSGNKGFGDNGNPNPASPNYDGNAFWNNTGGNRGNIDDTTGINGVAPYTNVNDVIVTDGSPFTNEAGGDFTLNNTALRGALLRGTGTPGGLPGISQVGYMDFGALQSQATGGGGIFIGSSDLSGGLA